MIKELFNSIKNHNIARVKQIIEEHPKLINTYFDGIEALDAQHKTPLILAAELGHIDIVQFLLEHKTDITKNAIGCCYYDALYAIIQQESPSIEIVKLLLDAGINVNSSHECRNRTALTEAAARGLLEIAQLLIKRGADVNKQMTSGESETPLMAAAQVGNIEMVKFLLRSHADPSLINTHGETALTQAMKNRHESVALLLEEALNKNNIK